MTLKEKKGKQARRVDVQKHHEATSHNVDSASTAMLRKPEEKHSRRLKGRLSAFLFIFQPRRRQPAGGASTRLACFHFLGGGMGKDPDLGQVGLLPLRLELAPRALDGAVERRAGRRSRSPAWAPGVTPTCAAIRDWPQMRCAMDKRKKPGWPAKRSERARSFHPREPRCSGFPAPVTPEPFLFLRQWSSVFPLCRRSRDPSGKFGRCLSRHPPTMRPTANSPPRANPWPRRRPL